VSAANVGRIAAGLDVAFRRVDAGKRFQFGDDTVQLFEQGITSGFAKFVYEGPVIPESAFFFAGEPFEHSVAVDADFMQGLAGVGKLVRGGDQAHVVRFSGYSLDISALPLDPWRFWVRVRIGAAVDDVRDAFAELSLNFAQTRLPALVFHRVVKQCSDGHFFVAAVFDHNGRDAQKMADVGPFRALANLACVEARRVAERLNEAAGKDAWSKAFGDGIYFRQRRRVFANNRRISM